MYAIRVEETHSTLILFSSLSALSPAITKSSWICLLNFSSTSISPSPLNILAQISFLSHLKYCTSLFTGLPSAFSSPLQPILQTIARVIFPNTNLMTSVSPNSPPQIKSFIHVIKCQVMTTYIRSMWDFPKGVRASYQLFREAKHVCVPLHFAQDNPGPFLVCAVLLGVL